jgi:hypothetical protein
MNLNHLDLQVSDVPGHVEFFERVFGEEEHGVGQADLPPGTAEADLPARDALP